MNIYRNIDRSKVQFDFLVHKREKGDFEDEITDLGGKIYRIPYVTEAGHFGYVKALNEFFKKYQEYKVVHAHMDCMSGLVLRAAKKAGVPARISHSHNTQSEGNFPARLYKSYAGRKILKNATYLAACSTAAAAWLFGKHAINALIVKNGIESERFLYNEVVRSKMRKSLKIGCRTLVIGHVGRFCTQKNHSFLIEVFARLKAMHKDAILLLIGDGPLKEEIQNKARQLNIADSVRFCGKRADVPELLQAVDVILFPSYHEGLPLALIEAQAAGIKCVVSDFVSKEVDLGAGLITFLGLDEDADKWAAEALKPYVRNADMRDYIIRNGYDIEIIANAMQNFYLGAYFGMCKTGKMSLRN